MPYSTEVADMVLPDTPQARQEAANHHEDGLSVVFCNEYEEDDQYGPNPVRGQCLNRNPWGDRMHNWCYGCMAGFIFGVTEDNPYSDSTTTGRLLASR